MMGNYFGGSFGYMGMLWMILPCLLLLGVSFLGGGNAFSSGYVWPILLGAFLITHIWMMVKDHAGRTDTPVEGKIPVTPAPEKPETKEGDEEK